MGPEVGRLQQQGLDGERGPPLRAEAVAEVQRRPLLLDDDGLPDPRQPELLLEVGQDLLPHPGGLRSPVDPPVQVWHRSQDVEHLATGGRKGGIGPGWRVDVQGRLARRHPPLEQVAQDTAVVSRHDDGVVTQLRVAPVQS